MSNSAPFNNKKETNGSENQDGGVGGHAAPPHTTRTNGKSNGKEVRHQGKKNKHSSRSVGGVEMGSQGGEDSSCPGRTETGGVWDEWGSSPTTSRPCDPTFAHRLTGPQTV